MVAQQRCGRKPFRTCRPRAPSRGRRSSLYSVAMDLGLTARLDCPWDYRCCCRRSLLPAASQLPLLPGRLWRAHRPKLHTPLGVYRSGPASSAQLPVYSSSRREQGDGTWVCRRQRRTASTNVGGSFQACMCDGCDSPRLKLGAALGTRHLALASPNRHRQVVGADTQDGDLCGARCAMTRALPLI